MYQISEKKCIIIIYIDREMLKYLQFYFLTLKMEIIVDGRQFYSEVQKDVYMHKLLWC